MNPVADLARYRALQAHAAELEATLREAPPGEGRDEMAAEALAARARMLELEQGSAAA
jgi:hypothetical protein